MSLFDCLRLSILSPLRRTSPLSISSSRQIQRASVLFPEPLGPITETTSPSFTERDMSSKTVRLPNDFFSPRTSKAGTDEDATSVKLLGTPFTSRL